MQMSFPQYLVDAFADAPFAGNSAAVCLLPDAGDGASDAAWDTAWMQAMAAELHQPATAFVRRPGAAACGCRWTAARAPQRSGDHRPARRASSAALPRP